MRGFRGFRGFRGIRGFGSRSVVWRVMKRYLRILQGYLGNVEGLCMAMCGYLGVRSGYRWPRRVCRVIYGLYEAV